MQYRQFEEALVGMFSIHDSDLGAFRARLRHLRNLGVPNIPKAGSGHAHSYSQGDLFATSIALALHMLGFAPAISALIAKKAGGQIYLFGGTKEVFLIVANVPERALGNDFLEIQPGVMGFSWIKSRLGNDVYAAIVLGAVETGKIVISAKTIACSVINLTERYKALPPDA